MTKFFNNPSYDEMALYGDWDLLDDLDGGTRRMRVHASKYLPKEKEEKDIDYNRRVLRSFLYEYFKNTLDIIASMPFSKHIIFSNNPPSYILENADCLQSTFEEVLHSIFRSALKYGVAHAFVDYTTLPSTPMSIAEERYIGTRAVIIPLTARQVFNWEFSVHQETLLPFLSKVCFHEVRQYAVDGKVIIKNFIREYTPDSWRLLLQDDTSKEYHEVNTGTHNFGSIPIFTFYTNRTGFMTADPPFRDLAYLNLAHFQSFSDQRNILRFARIGILFGAGFREDTNITVSPNSFTGHSSEGAKLEYVEYKGRALEAGFKDLNDLESKMEILGHMPLRRNARSSSTATGEMGDDSKTLSPLQKWILSFESFSINVLRAVYAWERLEFPVDFHIDIFSDFKVNTFGNLDAAHILKATINNRLSTRTYIKEMQRRGILSGDIDPLEEEQRALDIGMQMKSLTKTQAQSRLSMPEEDYHTEPAEDFENAIEG